MNNTAILHSHSVFSLNDGAISAHDARVTAEKLGIPALALTDHGTLMGIEAFAAEFKDSSVKFIPGVEAYISDTENREHLVLLPIDNIGYKAIMKAVTFSNIGGDAYPSLTIDDLNEFFGEGTDAHGHIIACSACINGVLASELRFNERLEKEAAAEERKADKQDFDYAAYSEISQKVEKLQGIVNSLTETRKNLKLLGQKKFTKRLKALEKMDPGSDEYREEKIRLDREMTESKQAEIDFPAAKEKEAEAAHQLSELKAVLKKYEIKAAKIQEYTSRAEEIRSGKISDEDMFNNCLNKAGIMIAIFGHENFYIEIQYHGIDTEAEVYPRLVDVAHAYNLKIVCTNDAHIPEGTKENRLRRQILRSLRFNKWEDENVGDDQLYYKTDEELVAIVSQIIPAEIVCEALQTNNEVAARCNVTFDYSEHYPKWNGKETAEQRLWDLCEIGKAKVPNWNDKYQKRLEYEMEVIKQLKVCDYLAIVQDFLEYGRLLGKIDLNDPRYLADPYNIELLKELGNGHVGMSIGFGRGSAVGSLVCYLTGITGADPICYDLIFERFLNSERVTMPDIDSDFSPEVRGKVLDYVKHRYGEAAVCGIMTVGTQEAKNAVRNCARVLGDQHYGNSKYFLDLSTEICKEIPTAPGTKLSDCVETLKEKYGSNPEALEIINDARLVEGTFTTIGMHAAGVIIADNGNVGDYIPLMKSKDGLWITQCDKDYCEGKGLLKMDFLGLINLAIITETLRAIQKNTGRHIDMERDVNLDDPKIFSEIFAKGQTNSVFQFESDGMKGLLKRFKPDCIEDLILLNAMYRPGPIQYIDPVCDVKAGIAKPTYIIPEMGSVLGVTYGKPIYQEQILQIFNKFAGFSLGEADIIRRLNH